MRRHALRNLGVRLVVLGTLFLGGCSTGHSWLAQKWSSPEARPGSVGKLLVIGLSDRDVTRRVFETELSTLFREKRVDAMPSFQLLPELPEASDEGTEVIRSAIAGRGFDSVLVTRLLGIDTKTTEVPGRTEVVEDWDHPYRFYPYYARSYKVVHQPGYTVQNNIVRLETNVYDVASEGLIWAAVSETFNPASLNDIVRTFGAEVVRDLENNKLLPRPR